MTIEQIHKYFDLLFDKVEEPYLTSDEKDVFINRATFDYINDFFKPTDGVRNGETASFDTEALIPIIQRLSLDTDNIGRLFYTDIDAQTDTSFMYLLNAAIKESGCEVTANYRPSRFVRHNDFFKHQDNSFKEGTKVYPIHRYLNTHIQFNPAEALNTQITIIKEPVMATLDDPNNTGTAGPNAVNVELPDKTHNNIVYRALNLTSVEVREADFYSMTQQLQSQNIQ